MCTGRAVCHHATTMATGWSSNSWEHQMFAKLTLDQLSTWLVNVQMECQQTRRNDKYEEWISWWWPWVQP
jgi:hypothetical protein